MRISMRSAGIPAAMFAAALVLATTASSSAVAAGALPPIPPITLPAAPMAPDVLRTPTANTTLVFRWVGGGDSFGAGEGNPLTGIADRNDPNNFSGLSWGSDTSLFHSFGASTNRTNDLFTCHRSDKAGAPKANQVMKTLYPDVTFSFDFVACSGSKTTALVSNGYTGPGTSTESMRGHPRVQQPSQIERAKAFAGSNILDAFYMSSGGNNAGFGDLVTNCVTPFSDCTHDWAGPGGLLSQKLNTLPNAYNAVDTKFHAVFVTHMPNILISDYPNPMDDGVTNPELIHPACYKTDFERRGEIGFGARDDFLRNELSATEADFAFGAAAAINSQVNLAAGLHSWIIVDGHVNASKGHGFCASDPYFNLNSDGLHTQGHDLPAPLFDISAGLLHPNNKGYNAYADAIVARLRPVIDRKESLRLLAPANVRIAAAVVNGSITVHWDDRSSAENAFDVEVVPADASSKNTMTYPAGVTHLANGGYIQRVAGANLQSYVHHTAVKGRYTYRVRACNTHIQVYTPATIARCGSFSAPTTGANSVPAAPTGLTFTAGSMQIPGVNGGPPLTVATRDLHWVASVDALEYVVRTDPPVGSPTIADRRTKATVLGLGVAAVAKTEKFSVAACNRAGCSPFSVKVTPT
jgi:hypothetical protein